MAGTTLSRTARFMCSTFGQGGFVPASMSEHAGTGPYPDRGTGSNAGCKVEFRLHSPGCERWSSIAQMARQKRCAL